jgi:hypothetical protein
MQSVAETAPVDHECEDSESEFEDFPVWKPESVPKTKLERFDIKVAIVPAYAVRELDDEGRHEVTHFPDFNKACDLMRDDKDIKVHRYTSKTWVENIRRYVTRQHYPDDVEIQQNELLIATDINGTVREIPHYVHVQLGQIPGCTSGKLVFIWDYM